MVGAIIQARMNSDRYPGKVLFNVHGKPLLQYIMESLSMCNSLDQIVVATSVERTDDPLAEFCGFAGISCFRGPLQDVAGRFFGALSKYKFDGFVRVSGDSPLIDYRLVDKAVNIFESYNFDVVTNILERTFPKGQSVEVIRTAIFRSVYPLMETTEQLEHVTRFFYSHQKSFAIYNFESGEKYGDIQLSVDTEDDMRKFQSLVKLMRKPHWEYSFEEIVSMIPCTGNGNEE